MKYQVGDLVQSAGLLTGIILELDIGKMSIFWLTDWSVNPQWYEQADRYIKKLEAK